MKRPQSHGGAVATGLTERDSDTLRRAIALVQLARDPALPGLVFLLGLAVAGGVTVAVTALRIGDTPHVALQTPHVVSGGLAGVALIAVGALLAAVHAERRARVLASKQMRHVVDGVDALVLAAARSRAGRKI